MRELHRLITGGLLLLSLGAGTTSQAQQPQSRRPMTATVCSIADHPDRYDGTIVRVRAVLAQGSELAALRDPERRCAEIWIADTDSQDASLSRLEEYSAARLRNKRHPLDYAPPRYAITATFIGRLQHTHDSGFVLDRKSEVTGIKGGFGHLGQYKTQMHLSSVTDLNVRDLLGTVYAVREFEPVE